jgi:predicted nucleic acid-binding Zn ribbon protein
VKDASGFRSLGEIVGEAPGVLDRLTRTTGELGRLERVWPMALGAELAAHCRPALVDGARVTVHADAAVWASRLRHLQSTTLARLADSGFSGITELRIVVRPK